MKMTSEGKFSLSETLDIFVKAMRHHLAAREPGQSLHCPPRMGERGQSDCHYSADSVCLITALRLTFFFFFCYFLSFFLLISYITKFTFIFSSSARHKMVQVVWENSNFNLLTNRWWWVVKFNTVSILFGCTIILSIKGPSEERKKINLWVTRLYLCY